MIRQDDDLTHLDMTGLMDKIGLEVRATIYSLHCFKAKANPGLLIRRRVYGLTRIKTFIIHCEGFEEARGEDGPAEPSMTGRKRSYDFWVL